ncbi:coiled-coil domain-containing protein 81-like [Polypterus senegalus]|uniref:coiled-coil domain-containing protein 81-like n=1 Tax=Polypterus senegalus TaxID=55291 RepID=UPI001962B698|nr:coiled-coil domain-containing protein 81-like [Polypterus senegalus]
MIETVLHGVREGEKNSLLTLSKLSESDIDIIWTHILSFIEGQMALQKGVNVPGLGMFTFSQYKLDIGHKSLMTQRPVFQLSEKLAQTHGLEQYRLPSAGDVPVVPLNFTSIALESSFDRDTVEGCMRDTLLLLSRTLASKRNVLFNFRGIGVLSVRNGKVKMKFYRDFLNSMDTSGNLLNSLCNRPGTCDSVISSREMWPQRPGTSNTVLFPSIQSNELIQKKKMEQIKEEQRENEETESDQNEENELMKEQEKGDSFINRNVTSRQALHPAKVTWISLTDNLQEEARPKTSPERIISEFPIQQSLNERQEQEYVKPRIQSHQQSLGSACVSHGRAGQELCYLCMQRAQNNVPVSFAEERQRKEKDDERVLIQYQQQKDQNELLKQQAQLLAAREQNQKVSSFNLGVSEAIRNRKNARSIDFQNSYILLKRPLTPPRFPKQQQYHHNLAQQVEMRKEKESKRKQDEDFLDRLEQVQLAEDLAAEKEKRLTKKVESISAYQKQLDAQLKSKPPGVPKFEPDSDGPIFGIHDLTNEKLLQKRQRAHQIYRQQLEESAKKKRDALFNHIMEQKKEQDLLEKSRRELITDRMSRYEKLSHIRKSLQDDWARSIETKHQREQQEEQYTKSGGMLLLDQCEKYRRCFQCKRRPSNCGESNIWKESRYIPGSRLMV